MDPLKKKIQETRLFTDKEKIEILAEFDAVTAADRVKLEAIIDEYDAKYNATMGTFRRHINEELDSIESDASADEKERVKDSVDKIRSGLTAILPE